MSKKQMPDQAAIMANINQNVVDLTKNAYDGIDARMRAVVDATRLLDFVAQHWTRLFDDDKTKAQEYADLIASTAKNHGLFLKHSFESAAFFEGALRDKKPDGAIAFLAEEKVNELEQAIDTLNNRLSGKVETDGLTGMPSSENTTGRAFELHRLYTHATGEVFQHASAGQNLCGKLMQNVVDAGAAEEFKELGACLHFTMGHFTGEYVSSGLSHRDLRSAQYKHFENL